MSLHRLATLCLLYLLLFVHGQTNKKALNEFINYYEPVEFRAKERFPTTVSWILRPMTSVEQVEIRAFGRTFQLALNRSERILSPDAEINVLSGADDCKKKELACDTILAHLVEGRVMEEPDSYVHGALRNGVFTGVIYLMNQTFFVERASKYFREKMPFDCVIFRQEDLNMTAFDCVVGPEGYKCDPIRLLQRTGPASQQVLPVLEEIDAMLEKSWFKRKSKKTTCRLKVVADHLFYQFAGDNSVENAIYEMIFHIHEADRIFRATDFDEDGQPDNVGFRVQAIEVYTTAICLENAALAKPSLTSDQYLEIFSERDFHNYCVGVAFSGFTFPGRVLGIAWMADADNTGYVGGICEPRLFSTQDQKALSFNAAVVTTMLEGRRMPRGITAIAVAHELGHSFGSDHDPYQDAICSPSREEGGKYIMAAFAVKGDQPNNRYFSPCSKRNMKNVLKKKGTCFTTMTTVSNYEESAMCECKMENVLNVDGLLDKETVSVAIQENESQVLEEPRECSFVPYADEPSNNEDMQACHITDDECFAPPSLCDSATWCPSPQKMPDGSSCLDGRGECWEGTCIVDPCNLHGQKSCECPDIEKSCIVCCKSDEESAECQPIRRKDAPWWLLRRPGEPCGNGLGQCDFRGQCEVKPQAQEKDVPCEKAHLVDDVTAAGWEHIGGGINESWVKAHWWRRLFVQLMWICLGFVALCLFLFCACFLGPAVAVGFWCLRQCSYWPQETEDVPLVPLHGSVDQINALDVPANPVPDVQTRSRSY